MELELSEGVQLVAVVGSSRSLSEDIGAAIAEFVELSEEAGVAVAVSEAVKKLLVAVAAREL